MINNPYVLKPDYCFWSRAVSDTWPGQIDPVTRSINIESDSKICTMGSCFAQHIAKFIEKAGFNHYVTEKPPLGMSSVDLIKHNYGIFSARYGNVYTVRQALQLLRRAYGLYSPVDSIWLKNDSFIDAFRPTISPHGFLTEDDLIHSREQHLAYVRQVFEEADIFIFTLGLTETWISNQDGAVYPVAPGVSGGEYETSKYAFKNFMFEEVLADLREFVSLLKERNPKIQIILTVSPVPLIATYENRHILVSTVASKSILRAVADQIEREFDFVIYFPSYELITSQATSKDYYAEDLRSVTEAGINHVMRVFKRHFLSSKKDSISHQTPNFPSESFQVIDDVICDEELIEQALKTYRGL